MQAAIVSALDAGGAEGRAGVGGVRPWAAQAGGGSLSSLPCAAARRRAGQLVVGLAWYRRLPAPLARSCASQRVPVPPAGVLHLASRRRSLGAIVGRQRWRRRAPPPLAGPL